MQSTILPRVQKVKQDGINADCTDIYKPVGLKEHKVSDSGLLGLLTKTRP